MDYDLCYMLLRLLDNLQVCQSTQFTSDYIKLTTQQHNLVTTQLFFGFFIHEQKEIQNTYLKLVSLVQGEIKANSCIGKVVTEILSYICLIWLLCNSHAHYTDLNDSNFYQLFQLLHRIKQKYTQQSKMVCSNRDLFALPIKNQHSFHNIYQLKKFVSYTKPLKQSISNKIKPGKINKKLEIYFPPTEHPILVPDLANQPPPKPDPNH